jgi:hypothetical protein
MSEEQFSPQKSTLKSPLIHRYPKLSTPYPHTYTEEKASYPHPYTQGGS